MSHVQYVYDVIKHCIHILLIELEVSLNVKNTIIISFCISHKYSLTYYDGSVLEFLKYISRIQMK